MAGTNRRTKQKIFSIVPVRSLRVGASECGHCLELRVVHRRLAGLLRLRRLLRGRGGSPRVHDRRAHQETGAKFNRNIYELSFSLKTGLRFFLSGSFTQKSETSSNNHQSSPLKLPNFPSNLSRMCNLSQVKIL